MPQGIVYLEPRERDQRGAQAAMETAKARGANLAEQIREARQTATKQKADLYGETLGKMYDGHRNAITFYRDQLSEKWKKGGYYEQPDEFNNDLAQLNAMIEQAEQYYTGTYGTDASSGEGFTFLDGQTRSMLGNSVQFYEDKGLSLGDLDEFDWMQSRLDYVNSGGYDPNSMRINEQGQLVARALDQRTGMPGDEMPIFEMPHVMAGGKTFMPDLTAVATATLYDHAMTEDYQNQAKRVQNSLINAAPSSPVTYYDPTDDSADENGYVTKKAGELTEEQQQIYISDQYFDNHMNTSRFRRMIVDDVFQGLNDAQRQQYIDEGSWDGMTDLDLQQARRKWREVSRFSKEEEKPSQTKETDSQRTQRVQREELTTASRLEAFEMDPKLTAAMDGVEQAISSVPQDKSNRDRAIARSLEDLFEENNLEDFKVDWQMFGNEVEISGPNSSVNLDADDPEFVQKLNSWIESQNTKPTTPEGFQLTMTALKNKSATIRVPVMDKDGETLKYMEVEPVDIQFFPSTGEIRLSNIYVKSGDRAGEILDPIVLTKDGSGELGSAQASAWKQLEDNIRSVYGDPNITLEGLMAGKMNIGEQRTNVQPSTSGGGELD
jgi:hypothetical protein